MKTKVFHRARSCLEEKDLDKKLLLSSSYAAEVRDAALDLNYDGPGEISIGRPARPVLVSPSRLSKRGFASQALRVAMAHAIAHIEFNAINLAWDAIWRFRNMPEEYYRDWAGVAHDETRHFMLLRNYLKQNGSDYGDFDAHDGLWTMAENTASDVLDRMAIVPRVLEARGLDVTPAMIEKCHEQGDREMAEILETIYQEEIGHVRIGNHWYSELCKERGLEPLSTFLKLVRTYNVADRSSRINDHGRKLAGFSTEELDAIRKL